MFFFLACIFIVAIAIAIHTLFNWGEPFKFYLPWSDEELVYAVFFNIFCCLVVGKSDL